MDVVVAPRNVLDTFSDQMSSIHNRVLFNQRESRTLSALRDTLLPKLISGELRLSDVEKILEDAL